MERLTNKREADAQREEYERRLANGYPRNIPEEQFLRLAAYEDTGLTPEEILPKDKEDEIALKLMRLSDLESLCSYNRLRELAEAGKDGRVVVLPCKVGDTVYFRTYDCNGKVDLGIQPHKVTAIAGSAIVRGGYIDIGLLLGQYGVSWFLTREGAEKALEEGRV